MVTERTIEFRVKVKLDVERVTDSPYWPGFATGKPEETTQVQLVQAEIQNALEDLSYINDVKVEEVFG